MSMENPDAKRQGLVDLAQDLFNFRKPQASTSDTGTSEQQIGEHVGSARADGTTNVGAAQLHTAITGIFSGAPTAPANSFKSSAEANTSSGKIATPAERFGLRKPFGQAASGSARTAGPMTFTIRGVKDGEIIETVRTGPTLSVAKARGLFKTGWTVEILDSEGISYGSSEFDQLLSFDRRIGAGKRRADPS
jgi:hypothetical protein